MTEYTSHPIDTLELFRGNGTQYEIQDNANLTPDWIVVREIDLAPPGSIDPFTFKSPDRRHVYTPNYMQTLVQHLIDGTYRPNGRVNHYFRPLDVKLSAPTCFIFHLSNRWNWRFSSKQAAVTLGEADTTVQQRYANVRHFIDQNGQPDPYGHGEFCRTICFTAVPELNAMQEVIHFEHRFNLIVEFVYPDGDGPSPENLIPVIIDPDVRFPGGSGQ